MVQLRNNMNLTTHVYLGLGTLGALPFEVELSGRRHVIGTALSQVTELGMLPVNDLLLCRTHRPRAPGTEPIVLVREVLHYEAQRIEFLL